MPGMAGVKAVPRAGCTVRGRPFKRLYSEDQERGGQGRKLTVSPKKISSKICWKNPRLQSKTLFIQLDNW
jgi:hypothetical protein